MLSINLLCPHKLLSLIEVSHGAGPSEEGWAGDPGRDKSFAPACAGWECVYPKHCSTWTWPITARLWTQPTPRWSLRTCRCLRWAQVSHFLGSAYGLWVLDFCGHPAHDTVTRWPPGSSSPHTTSHSQQNHCLMVIWREPYYTCEMWKQNL